MAEALGTYGLTVLSRELARADYDGKTVDQAWEWLMVPATTTETVPTHASLTPLLVARVLGPMKAEVMAARMKASLPTIADVILNHGVDLSDPLTQAFLQSIIGDPILPEDVQKIMALATEQRQTTVRQFDHRFYPELWPHVAPDGSAGGPEDPAINGFPNDINRDDFNQAWLMAGRA